MATIERLIYRKIETSDSFYEKQWAKYTHFKFKCYPEIAAKIDGHSGSQKALYSAHVYNVPRDRLSADF